VCSGVIAKAGPRLIFGRIDQTAANWVSVGRMNMGSLSWSDPNMTVECATEAEDGKGIPPFQFGLRVRVPYEATLPTLFRVFA
jgi:hypothetical protein